MRIASIKNNDIANGPGIRVSLFTQYCPHRCKGCFNPETWSESGGYNIEITELANQLLEKLNKNNVKRGFSLLGGEPLSPEKRDDITRLVKILKNRISDLNIWCWTGYLWDEIKDHPVLEYIDILVDGPFIQEQKDISLKWKGSSNQRVINVKKSLAENKIVLYEGE